MLLMDFETPQENTKNRGTIKQIHFIISFVLNSILLMLF